MSKPQSQATPKLSSSSFHHHYTLSPDPFFAELKPPSTYAAYVRNYEAIQQWAVEKCVEGRACDVLINIVANPVHVGDCIRGVINGTMVGATGSEKANVRIDRNILLATVSYQCVAPLPLKLKIGTKMVEQPLSSDYPLNLVEKAQTQFLLIEEPQFTTTLANGLALLQHTSWLSQLNGRMRDTYWVIILDGTENYDGLKILTNYTDPNVIKAADSLVAL